MRFLFATFLFLSGCTIAAAQGCGTNNPNCIVPTAPIGTSDNRAASTAFVQQNVSGFLPPGVPTNVLNAQTSAYTVATTDCGKTIQLGGNAFYALTIPAASGFAPTCMINVQNVDTWGSGRAKSFGGAGNPATTPTLLWPTQTITFQIVNGAWAVFNFPARVKLPSSTTVTLNTDYTNGNDGNDGLGTGSGNALKTFEGCLGDAANFFDFNSTSTPSKVVCLGSGVSNNDAQGIHSPFHSFTGCQGGACVVLNLNGGTISATVQAYFGTVFQIRNGTLTNASGSCLESAWNAKIYVLDGVTFGPCTGGSAIIAHFGAGHIELDNNFTIAGGASQFITVSDGSSVEAASSITGAVSAAVSITNFVLAASPAYVNLQNITWNLAGNAVTGSEGIIELNGVVLQATATLSVTGAVAGTSSRCKLTVPTGSLAEGQLVLVASVGGTTGCNTTAPTAVTGHIVDSTHLELVGTTFGGTYTTGGTVQIGVPGTTNATITLGGQFL